MVCNVCLKDSVKLKAVQYTKPCDLTEFQTTFPHKKFEVSEVTTCIKLMDATLVFGFNMIPFEWWLVELFDRLVVMSDDVFRQLFEVKDEDSSM